MEITLKHLTKQYKNVTAVNDLSITIEDGQLICLLGPSGCGKSTTLSLIAGLEEPTSGEILFDGESVNHVEAEDRDLGMVFQNYALYPHMSVEQNIEFPLRMRGVKKSQRVLETAEIANLLQISSLLKRRPSQLSGGQQQRVAIARALVKQPKLLLLDEPFSNLDARLRIELRDEIRTLQKRLGITTIFVTHDQEEAMSISDKILLLNHGLVQQFAAPKEMYTHPSNRFAAGFLGNPPINFLPCRSEDGRLYAGSGRLWQLPLEKCAGQLLPGTLEAGIRPEDIYVAPPESPFDFMGRVTAVQTPGKEVYLKVEHNSLSLTACVTWDHNYSTGDEIPLSIKRFYLFSGESEVMLQ